MKLLIKILRFIGLCILIAFVQQILFAIFPNLEPRFLVFAISGLIVGLPIELYSLAKNKKTCSCCVVDS